MRNGERKYYSITEINLLVKELFDNTSIFRSITIKGEISNFKAYPKAFYFSLKDQESQLSAVMFFSYRESIAFTPKDGDEVLAFGSIKAYEKRGTYQLVVEDMIQYGVGIQLIKLQELKNKLDKEGLFAESRKRPLPRYPNMIGIIAGNDSAAYKDIVTNIKRRYPIVGLVFFPALVQGNQAPDDIIRALALAYKTRLDILIIGRGGGSEEDLFALNDEKVVRKIAESPIPTIGAIGHEINTTLADLVCDKRASTPTGAAELATRDKADINYEIQMLSKRMFDAIDSRMSLMKEQLVSLSEKPYFKNPLVIYDKQLANISLLKEQLKTSLLSNINRKKELLANSRINIVDPTPKINQYRIHIDTSFNVLSRLLINKHEVYAASLIATRKQLESLSPYQVLERGYSIITNEDGDIITNSNDVNIGEVVTTTLKHGKISSVVKERK